MSVPLTWGKASFTTPLLSRIPGRSASHLAPHRGGARHSSARHSSTQDTAPPLAARPSSLHMRPGSWFHLDTRPGRWRQCSRRRVTCSSLSQRARMHLDRGPGQLHCRPGRCGATQGRVGSSSSVTSVVSVVVGTRANRDARHMDSTIVMTGVVLGTRSNRDAWHMDSADGHVAFLHLFDCLPLSALFALCASLYLLPGLPGVRQLLSMFPLALTSVGLLLTESDASLYACYLFICFYLN